MKKNIVEELPVRKHPMGAGESKPAPKSNQTERSSDPAKKVKQAVYDIRYRARREDIPLRQAYSQYMQNTSMSQQERDAVKQMLFGKSGMQEDYKIEESAHTSVAEALYKVFVEGIEKDITLVYEEKMKSSSDRKYKVRVTDKNGKSYVRYATREKISQLRQNPNIAEVEMTEHGDPYEGRKKKKGDGNLANNYPPYDRVTRGDVIAGAKGEDQMGGKIKESYGITNQVPIDVMKKNKTNKVTMMPSEPNGKSKKLMNSYRPNTPFIIEKAESRAQQKFMGMVYAAKTGKKPASPEVAKAAKGMSGKEAKKYASTKHKGLPEKKMNEEMGERDKRADYAYREMIKNKLRAGMGIKNPMVMSNPENLEKDFNKVATAKSVKSACD